MWGHCISHNPNTKFQMDKRLTCRKSQNCYFVEGNLVYALPGAGRHFKPSRLSKLCSEDRFTELSVMASVTRRLGCADMSRRPRKHDLWACLGRRFQKRSVCGLSAEEHQWGRASPRSWGSEGTTELEQRQSLPLRELGHPSPAVLRD